jgi:hypothetical protein
MDKIADVLEALKSIPTQFLIAVAIALGLVLFLPDHLAATLAVDGFRQSFRIFLGPAFIVICSFLLARICALALVPFRQRQNLKALEARLKVLTAEEKGYLVPFILGGQNTIHVSHTDGTAGGLRAKEILYLGSNMFSLVEGMPLNMQPWARRYLEANPQLLEGAAGRPLSPSEQLWGRG